MSLLSTYQSLLTEKIATSSTAFHSAQNRLDAINEATANIVEAYDIPSLIKKGTLSFTSGVGVFPTDYVRMIKLWVVVNSTVQEFTYMPVDQFDEQSANNANYWWTVDYDTGTAALAPYIVPTTVTSANIRYYRTTPTLVNPSDDSLLPVYYDDAVAYWAASILMRNESNFAKAKEYDEKRDQSLNSAIQAVRKLGGVKQNERLRSTFESFPILSGRTP